METTQQKAELRKLVTKLYEECGVAVRPTRGKVLIRVLPREQKVGSIYLPDGKQNKPTWEGVVIATYLPYFQKVYVKDINWRKDDWDQEATYMQLVRCELEPGDHILFPHIEYGVVPVWPLDDGVGDYRLIPENIVEAKVEYTQVPVKAWLIDLLEELRDERKRIGDEATDIVRCVLDNADVIRKDLVPKTMSGA